MSRWIVFLAQEWHSGWILPLAFGDAKTVEHQSEVLLQLGGARLDW